MKKIVKSLGLSILAVGFLYFACAIKAYHDQPHDELPFWQEAVFPAAFLISLICAIMFGVATAVTMIFGEAHTPK